MGLVDKIERSIGERFEKIINSGKRVLQICVVGGSALLSGCFPLYAVGAAAGSYNAMTATTAREAAAWRAYSEFMNGMAQEKVTKEAAREGRSNNVIVIKNYVPEQRDYVFAYESCNDENGDGARELKEFKGRGKRVFKPDEKISFALYNNTKPGSVHIELFPMDNPQNKMTSKSLFLGEGKNWHLEEIELKPGIYTVVFKRDEHIVDSVVIEVRDK